MPYLTSRVDSSRALVRHALDMAYGSYVEQEGKKADQWRDQDVWTLFHHLEHELEEVRGNLGRGELGFLIHNTMDVIELGAILLCKAEGLIENIKEVRDADA